MVVDAAGLFSKIVGSIALKREIMSLVVIEKEYSRISIAAIRSYARLCKVQLQFFRRKAFTLLPTFVQVYEGVVDFS